MPKKILLADDSITIQKVVELTFSDGDYEVVATNNGANAIEEIPKVGPDIILSDIIMPEKNGYEVCEWVKSSSEHRHIPVILLTGTFEPFDPDRAEKAGCDAVVTKPFESQSLIQKVEELIGDRGGEEPPAEEPSVGQPSAEEQPLGEPSPTPPQPEAPEEVPPPPPPAPEQTEAAPEQEGPAFELGEPSAEPSRPFEEAPPEPSASQAETPFPPETEEPKPQGDVFGAETQPESESIEDNETRMIPKMSMEDIQRMQQQEDGQADSDQAAEEPAAAPEEVPPPPPPAPEQTEAAPEQESSPFESEPSEDEIEEGATKIIPKMSMEDIQRMQQQADEQADSDQTAEEPAAAPEAPPFGAESEGPAAEESPFGAQEPAAEEDRTEQPSEEDASTRMIPKMAPEDVQRIQEEKAQQEAAEAGTEEAAPGPFEAPVEEEAAEPPAPESAPFTEPPAEEIPPPALPPEEPAMPGEPESTTEPEAAPEPPQDRPAAASVDLTEEQVDRIARRVVELLSDKAVRDIAWEVIPETAEMVVKERIRELEAEEA